MHSAALHRRVDELEAELESKSEKILELRKAAVEAVDKLSVFMSVFRERLDAPRLTGQSRDVVIFNQLRLEGFPIALKILQEAIAFSLDGSSR